MLDLSLPLRPDASEEWTSALAASVPEPLEPVEEAVKAVESNVVPPAKGFLAGLKKAFGGASEVASNTDAAATVDTDLADSGIIPSPPSPSPPERVFCAPFLDTASSSRLTRTLWLPFEGWQKTNEWGELCLLKKVDKR